jgi:hypothetical protein
MEKADQSGTAEQTGAYADRHAVSRGRHRRQEARIDTRCSPDSSARRQLQPEEDRLSLAPALHLRGAVKQGPDDKDT